MSRFCRLAIGLRIVLEGRRLSMRTRERIRGAPCESERRHDGGELESSSVNIESSREKRTRSIIER